MAGELYIAGENIPAGHDVVVRHGVLSFGYRVVDGVGPIGRGLRGPTIGVAVESLREGFKILVRDGEASEDDA
jgi:hypothetical protein